MRRRPGILLPAAGIVLLLVVSILGYSRMLSVPLLLDDLAAVDLLHPEGPLDPSRIPRVLWPSEEAFRFHDHFRPLGWASLVLDDLLFGLHPGPLRVVAILIHGLSGALVALGVRRLTEAPWRAPGPWIAGALFVLWPVAVEPVVWVAHRFTLLATLFFLAALLPAVRAVRSGSGWALFGTWVLASLLSKDSMLAQVWALPAGAAALALLERRGLRRPLGLALVTGACVALVLALRLAATGALLPAYEAGGTVLETFRPSETLAGVPGTLRMLVAPVTGSGPALVLGAGVLIAGVLALAGRAGVAALTRRQPGAGAAWALLLVLLAAGLPVLAVGPDLEGSRHLYLPAAALMVLLGTALPGSRGWWLAGVALSVGAFFLTARHQEVYLEAEADVETVLGAIDEAAEPGERVIVTGLPATRRAAPLFGPRAAHLHLYFRPPLRDVPYEVLGRPREAVADTLARTPPPVRILEFSRAGSGGLLGVHLELVAPDPAKVRRSLEVLHPRPGTLWNGATLRVALPGPVPAERIYLRLRVEVRGTAGELVARAGPGEPRNGNRVLYTLDLADPDPRRFPYLPSRLEELAALCSGPAVPATLRLQVMGPSPCPWVGHVSPRVALQLGSRR